MKVLIDLQHPAHLHFFRPLTQRLRAEGHAVRLTGRDKDILVQLDTAYGLGVEIFGRARPGLMSMGLELLHRWTRLYRIMRRWQPDVVLAIAGTYCSLPARLTGRAVYVFYDTEHASMSNRLAYPFATCIFVPHCYTSEVTQVHQRYAGYHELAYLHPRHFTPDRTVLDEAGLTPEEPFVIVRWVGWGAAHDRGQTGVAPDQKLDAVRRLAEHARVLVSVEGALPDELERFRFRLPPHRMHHLLAHARLIFGESGTMPSEGAMLGVPGVYTNPLRLGYLEELEQQYGLVFTFRADHDAVEGAIRRGVEILRSYDAARWRDARDRLLRDKIDVTEMLWRIVHERPHTQDPPIAPVAQEKAVG